MLSNRTKKKHSAQYFSHIKQIKHSVFKRLIILFAIFLVFVCLLKIILTSPLYISSVLYFLSEFSLLPSKYIHIISPKVIGEPHDYSFKETNLPIFNMDISKENFRKLDRQIPIYQKNNFEASLQDFKWSFVEATFDHNKKSYPASIRFRGWFQDHYRLKHKKSWRINVKKNQHFNGIKSFNIINQRTSGVIEDALQYFLLKKDGHFVLQQKLVHLRINGLYAGIQTYLEQPDDMLFSRRNLPIGQIIGEDKMFFSEQDRDNINNWTIYTGEKENIKPLKELINLFKVKETPNFMDHAFEVIDVGQFAHYLADATITKKMNPSSHNYRFYFDPKKGLFQVLPWYQHGYYYADLNFKDPASRSNYLVLNDIAHGLFLDKSFFQFYQRLIWNKINNEYHPYVLNKIATDLVHATTPDILADSHMHNYFNKDLNYLSNSDQMKRLDQVFSSIKAFDKHIRNDLAYSNVKVNLNTSISKKHDFVAQLETSSHVAPKIEEICLTFNNALKSPLRLEIFNSKTHEWITTKSKPGATESCFKINVTLQADTYIDKYNRHGTSAGLFVAGFEPGTHVSILTKPTLFEFPIRLTRDVNQENFDKAFISGIHIKGVNSITGYDLNLSPLEVEKLTLDILPKPEHYDYKYKGKGINLVIPLQIDQYKYFEPSPGLRKWSYPYFKKLKPLHIKANTTWEINEDLILPFGQDVIIEEGVEVVLAPKASLRISGIITANGTEDNPIIFRSSSQTKAFGSIIITNNVNTLDQANRWGEIKHAKFIRGSNDTIKNVEYLGALSIISANVKMENVEFIDNQETDALNVVYSNSTIKNSTFINNADCIDYDFSSGLIDNNTFINCLDDAIDLSYSNTTIQNNVIQNSFDKGLSIGEKSKSIIKGNIISDSSVGIAVKDLSEASIVNNTISQNNIGLNLYIKKPEFGPSRSCLENNEFKNNKVDMRAEDGSSIILTSTLINNNDEWFCKEP